MGTFRKVINNQLGPVKLLARRDIFLLCAPFLRSPVVLQSNMWYNSNNASTLKETACSKVVSWWTYHLLTANNACHFPLVVVLWARKSSATHFDNKKNCLSLKNGSSCYFRSTINTDVGSAVTRTDVHVEWMLGHEVSGVLLCPAVWTAGTCWDHERSRAPWYIADSTRSWLTVERVAALVIDAREQDFMDIVCAILNTEQPADSYWSVNMALPLWFFW